jgi:biotin carboxylase
MFFIGIPEAHVMRSIARAQRLGYEVVLGDTRENLCRQRELVAGADGRVVTDYTCAETLLATARALDAESPLDVIVTFKEAGAVQTAQVAKALGLMTNDPEAVAACNDKSRTHAALSAAGLSTPRWALCADVHELAEFFGTVAAAVIVKPPDLQGSVGVHRLDDEADIGTIFDACLSVCEFPAVLAEELVVGREVSIEAMLYRSRPVIFGITEKLLYPRGFVECGHLTPDLGGELTLAQYQTIVERITGALGLTLGPLHIEGFHTWRGFVPTDVHTRYGGDQIVGITEAAAGCDMTSPVFAELGAVPYEIVFERGACHAGIRFFDVPAGRVLSVEGVSDAEALPEVMAVAVECAPGDQVGRVRSSFDRSGWVMARAGTRPDLLNALAEALSRIRVVTTTAPRENATVRRPRARRTP